MDHNLFIHLSVDGHWIISCLGAVINISAVNFHTQVFVWTQVSFILGKYLEVGFLGPMINFTGNCQNVFPSGSTILHSGQWCKKRSSFSTFSLALGIIRFLKF